MLFTHFSCLFVTITSAQGYDLILLLKLELPAKNKKTKKRKNDRKKTEIQTIDLSLIDCDHGASLCSRKLV